MSEHAVYAYIRRIKNPVKHNYACQYFAWQRRGAIAEDEPPPDPASLSYMAAQAVRLRLMDLAESDET